VALPLTRRTSASAVRSFRFGSELTVDTGGILRDFFLGIFLATLMVLAGVLVFWAKMTMSTMLDAIAALLILGFFPVLRLLAEMALLVVLGSCMGIFLGLRGDGSLVLGLRMVKSPYVYLMASTLASVSHFVASIMLVPTGLICLSTVTGRLVKVPLQPGGIWLPMALNHQAFVARNTTMISLKNLQTLMSVVQLVVVVITAGAVSLRHTVSTSTMFAVVTSGCSRVVLLLRS